MYLIDPNRGVPGGAKFYCPKMGKWFFKNSYLALYAVVHRARKLNGLKTSNLHKEIQKFVCKNMDPKSAHDFCTDIPGTLPPSHDTVRKNCCGGGKVK